MAAVLVVEQAFHHGRELEVATTCLTEETIESACHAGRVAGDNGQRVPFHIVMVEEFHAAHHLSPSGCPAAREAVAVVQVLRSVDGDAHQPTRIVEKLRPVGGEQCAVRLQAVVYLTPASVLLLQGDSLLVESARTQERFTTVPSKLYRHTCGLRLNVLLHKLLQHLIAHLVAALSIGQTLGRKRHLLGVVAVLTIEIAAGPSGLGHDIDRFQERIGGIHKRKNCRKRGWDRMKAPRK